MRKGFISYSHADRAICDALFKHLGDIHRTLVRFWRDPDLKPGEKWPVDVVAAGRAERLRPPNTLLHYHREL
ncbi:MAG: hypothetical protein AAFY85_08820, partial [Pseudomonadota bacterium]